MALDPMIANPTPLQLNDPMEQYGKFLTNSLLMDKMSEGQRTRKNIAATNELRKKHTLSDGTMNAPAYKYDLAQNDLGSEIDGFDKDQLANDQTRAENSKLATEESKARAEGLTKFVEFTRAATAGAKNMAQLTPLLAQVYKNDFSFNLHGGEKGALEAFTNKVNAGTAAEAAGGFDQWYTSQLLSPEKALENHFQMVEEKDDQRLVASNKYGTPFSRVTEAKYGAKPHSAGVTINTGDGANPFAKTLAELEAKDFHSRKKQAEAVPLANADIDRAYDLVDKAYTGYWSNGKYVLSAATGTNQDAVTATQQLNQILSTDMLKNIGTLRNEYDVKLGSVTEKEFAELQRTTPRATDTPATIKSWLLRAKDIGRRTQEDYRRLVIQAASNPTTSKVIEGMGITTPPALPGAPTTPQGAPWVDGMKSVNGKMISRKQYESLLRDRDADEFDGYFGAGSAARILGGASKGDRPFEQGR